jgi:hypothetical protein
MTLLERPGRASGPASEDHPQSSGAYVPPPAELSGRGWWRSPLAVTITCLVAAASYSGAITFPVLMFGLLPGLLLAAAVATALSLVGSPPSAAVFGVLVALACAELVNVLAGESNGPAARSTFAAAGFTAVAVAVAGGSFPALFLVGPVGVLAGALGLGSGAEVQGVAVATAVVGVLAMASVESESRRWVGRPGGRIYILVMALFCGGIATGVWLALDHRVERDAYVVSSTSVDATIHPPGLGLAHKLSRPSKPADSSSTTPSPTPSSSASANSATPLSVGSSGESMLARASSVVLVLGVLGAGALMLRLIWVAWTWRQLRRRLRRGEPAAVISGAWVWARRRLGAAGVVMPRSLSPDSVADGAVSDVPRRVLPPLQRLAAQVVVVAFSADSGASVEQASNAWQSANQAASAALQALPPIKRAQVWFRTPADEDPSGAG